jgi:hypothetical protein
MKCRHCGKRISLLKAFADGDFCSIEHRKLFAQQESDLALARLIEAQSRLERGSVPKPAPPARTASKARPRAAEPESVFPMAEARGELIAAIPDRHPSQPRLVPETASIALCLPALNLRPLYRVFPWAEAFPVAAPAFEPAPVPQPRRAVARLLYRPQRGLPVCGLSATDCEPARAERLARVRLAAPVAQTVAPIRTPGHPDAFEQAVQLPRAGLSTRMPDIPKTPPRLDPPWVDSQPYRLAAMASRLSPPWPGVPAWSLAEDRLYPSACATPDALAHLREAGLLAVETERPALSRPPVATLMPDDWIRSALAGELPQKRSVALAVAGLAMAPPEPRASVYPIPGEPMTMNRIPATACEPDTDAPALPGLTATAPELHDPSAATAMLRLDTPPVFDDIGKSWDVWIEIEPPVIDEFPSPPGSGLRPTLVEALPIIELEAEAPAPLVGLLPTPPRRPLDSDLAAAFHPLLPVSHYDDTGLSNPATPRIRFALDHADGSGARRSARARAEAQSDALGNRPVNGSGARRFWLHAPADLKWAALGLPLLLVLVIVSLRGRTQKVESPMPNSRAALGTELNSLQRVILRRAAVKLYDDFRGGLGSWQGDDGWAKSWRYGVASFLEPGQLALYTPSLGLRDYTMQFLGQVENHSLNWVFRARDGQNYYSMRIIVPKGGPLPEAKIVRSIVTDGKEQGLKELPIPFAIHLDTMYLVRMEVRGNMFTTYIQGQVVDNFVDDRLPEGGVGFYSPKGDSSLLRWVELTNQYDYLGRLCALLAPNGPETAGRVAE